MHTLLAVVHASTNGCKQFCQLFLHRVSLSLSLALCVSLWVWVCAVCICECVYCVCAVCVFGVGVGGSGGLRGGRCVSPETSLSLALHDEVEFHVPGCTQ